MQLTLDHVIVRAADPGATLAEFCAQAGAPVLAGVEDLGGMRSAIARTGNLDLEILRIGRDAPDAPRGYGLGFVADVALDEVVSVLRGLGLPTSMPVRGVAGRGAERRTWRAVQVHGLLPGPFRGPVSTRRPGALERVAARAAGALVRVPAVARAATRDAGESMVVVTEYDFDAESWRRRAASGPSVTEVHVGTAGATEAWRRLPLAAGSPLRPHDEGPPGVNRIVLGAGRPFSLGALRFDVAP